MQEKTCTKCKNSFPATTEYFHKDSQKKDGLYSRCRLCRIKAQPKTILSKEEKLERKREQRKKFAIANPEAHQAKLARKREAQRKRRSQNPKRYVDYQREYRKLHPDKIRADARVWSANRRARELNAEGFCTTKDIEKQMKIQKHLCYWCGVDLKDAKYEIDHVIPLSRGGTNYPNNLVISCISCNRRKRNRMPDDWKRIRTQEKLF